MFYLSKCKKIKIKDASFYIILGFFVLFGIYNSLISLLYNRSLWVDEAMLALNIKNNSYLELISPLDLSQVAPIGFLYFTKLLFSVLGKHDWSLRVFPYLSFLLSVPLFFILNKKLFSSTKIALLSCTFFSINYTLIFFSSEFKQYSLDTLVTILIFISVLNLDKYNNKKNLMLCSLIGLSSIWFSNIAILLLFTAGIHFTYYFFKKKTDHLILIPFVLWALSFFIYYIFFIYDHPHTAIMTDFWKNHFLPTDMFSLKFNYFIKTKLIMITHMLYAANPLLTTIPLFFVLLGIVKLSKMKQSKYMFLLIFPIFLHFIISGFHLYPVDKRLILYFLPTLIIFFSLGVWDMYEHLNYYPESEKGNTVLIFSPLLFILIIILPPAYFVSKTFHMKEKK